MILRVAKIRTITTLQIRKIVTLLERLTLIPMWRMRIFYGGNISKAYTQFKNLLSFQAMVNVSLNSLKIIELLQLVSIDKVSVSTEGKCKGRNEHWFQAKKGDTPSGDLDDATDENSGDKMNVVRDTIVKFL